MDNNSKEDIEENLSLINQQYLKELELNTNIFNEKIKNLNNNLFNTEEKNKSSSSHKKYRFNNSQIIEPTNLKYIYDFNKKDLNTIDNHHLNSHTYKAKRRGKEKYDDSINEINFGLKNRITELKKENEYKEYVINNLKNKLEENEKNKKVDFNYLEYNQLILEIEEKNNMIQKLEKVVKFLKQRNEELNKDNIILKNENMDLKSRLNNIGSEIDLNKINYLNYMKEMNNLKLEIKKLNLEMLNLDNKYTEINKENEKLNSLINEKNVIIYNYQKQLNLQYMNKNNNQFWDDVNNNNDKEENNINDVFKKYNYNKYFNNMEHESINNNANNIKNKFNKNNDLNFLENYLNSLLKERSKLENELIEVNESPKTFSDIKLKSNINNKIALNDKEIQETKIKLKNIRGY